MPKTADTHTVQAKWVGPFEAVATLEDGSSVTLVPGETIIEISAGEAEESAFWQPVKPAAKE